MLLRLGKCIPSNTSVAGHRVAVLPCGVSGAEHARPVYDGDATSGAANATRAGATCDPRHRLRPISTALINWLQMVCLLPPISCAPERFANKLPTHECTCRRNDSFHVCGPGRGRHDSTRSPTHTGELIPSIDRMSIAGRKCRCGRARAARRGPVGLIQLTPTSSRSLELTAVKSGNLLFCENPCAAHSAADTMSCEKTGTITKQYTSTSYTKYKIAA